MLSKIAALKHRHSGMPRLSCAKILKGQPSGITVPRERGLGAFRQTSEERELVRRYTGQLNTQEDRLAGLHKEIEELKSKKEATEDELDQMLERITMDESF
jgi:hypothetical protein